MVLVPRHNNPFEPGSDTRESLQRAVMKADQEAAAREEQAQRQNDVENLQQMIQRAGNMAKINAVSREISDNTITYTTDWVRQRRLSSVHEETHVKLVAHYLATRSFVGILIKPRLSSVQLYTRLHDVRTNVSSDIEEYPLLFTWSEDDPKIVYDANTEPHGFPDENTSGTLVQPDSDLFYEVSRCIQLFEDLKPH